MAHVSLDLISARAPETLRCTAGGVADGRGLVAVLSLGADVLCTRSWAGEEALAHPNLQAAAIRPPEMIPCGRA